MDEEMQDLYTWVDDLPLSRPKRNIARDFSDGVLMAEVLNNFYPKLIELHNYSAANSVSQKMYNWQTLNKKGFKRLHLVVTVADMEDVVNCVPGAVERLLKKVERGSGSDLSSEYDSRVGSFHSDKGGRGHSSGGRAANAPDMHRMAQAPPSHGPPSHGPPSHGPPSHGQGFPPAGPSYDYGPPPRKVGAGGGGGGNYDHHGQLQMEVDTEILVEKEQMIQELKEKVEILETKVKKLEQLVRLKDSKIQSLQSAQRGPPGRS